MQMKTVHGFDRKCQQRCQITDEASKFWNMIYTWGDRAGKGHTYSIYSFNHNEPFRKAKVSVWSVGIFWRCWLSDMRIDVILCWICKGKSHAIIPNFRLLVPVITIYYTVLQIKWEKLNMLTYMKAKYRGQAPSGVWMLLPSNGSTPSTDDIEISFCTRN